MGDTEGAGGISFLNMCSMVEDFKKDYEKYEKKKKN